MDTEKAKSADLGEVLARAVGGASGRTVGSSQERVIHPPVDVKETSLEFVVYVDLPGIDEDELEITMDDGTLAIRAVREFDHDGEDAEEYTRIERPYGRFECCVPLSTLADLDRATAKYKRGVLKVRLPKSSG